MVIFEGDDLRVLYEPVPGKEQNLIVTFTGHINKERLARLPDQPLRGGWQGMIAKLAKPALYFIANRNHWYNTPELKEALTRAREIRDNYPSATLMGASLGAHTAIRVSSRLNASAVVAISPQICIRPAIVGAFEKRWQPYAKAIKTYDDAIHRSRTSGDVRILYDSEDVGDAEHVRLLKNVIDCRAVTLPYSGHSSAKALHDLDLFWGLFDIGPNAIHNDEIMRHVAQVYADRASQSPQVQRIMAERLDAVS